jgi:hypothetical protein
LPEMRVGSIHGNRPDGKRTPVSRSWVPFLALHSQTGGRSAGGDAAATQPLTMVRQPRIRRQGPLATAWRGQPGAARPLHDSVVASKSGGVPPRDGAARPFAATQTPHGRVPRPARRDATPRDNVWSILRLLEEEEGLGTKFYFTFKTS